MKITHRNFLLFVLDEYPEKHDSADGSAKETLIVASDDNFRDIVSFSTGFYEHRWFNSKVRSNPPRSIAVQVQKFTVLAEKSAMRHELLRLSQR